MTANIRSLDCLRPVAQRLVVIGLIILASVAVAAAQNGSSYFEPGNLVVSRSVYDNNPNNVKVGETLPPNCQVTQAGCSGAATNDGTYPYVWNNDLVDGSFGITAKIVLDQYTPTGTLINSLEVPHSTGLGIPLKKDELVTSFSSKSEVALNLSTDGQYLTFMGYVAPSTIDVSNSNTPRVVDPTNPAGRSFYRAVAQVDAQGNFSFTETKRTAGTMAGPPS